jgi:DNA-binding MarR family transcriptional regulator
VSDTVVNDYHNRFAQIPLTLLLADTDMVSNNAKVLYALLWKYSDTAQREAFPGRRSLAESLGVSVDTVDRCVKQLVAIGAVLVEPQRSDDGGTLPNNYSLLAGFAL